MKFKHKIYKKIADYFYAKLPVEEPFSFYEVKDFMDKQKSHEADHHTARE